MNTFLLHVYSFHKNQVVLPTSPAGEVFKSQKTAT